MIELLLNAIRLAISEDARKSASSLIDLIRKSPEWERSTCVLEARITPDSREQANLLGTLTLSKMDTLRYSREARNSFEAAYGELVNNAFEHGCKGFRPSIRIVLEISQAYVAVTVVNTGGNKINLHELLKRQAGRENLKPRGRGLQLVAQLSDQFDNVEKNEGLKAVFFIDRCDFRAVELGADVVLIKVIGGIHNPSFSRRLLTEVMHFEGTSVVLDFTRFEAGTRAYNTVLQLSEIFSQSKRQIVALLSRVPDISLPGALIAHSCPEAAAKIGKSSIENQLSEAVRALRASG